MPLTVHTVSHNQDAPSQEGTQGSKANGEKYVDISLRTNSVRPHLTWKNVWGELDWLNVSILTGFPILTIWGLFTLTLKLQTLYLSIWYLLFTSIGKYNKSQ